MDAAYFQKQFQYKQWANQELLATARPKMDALAQEDAVFFIRILNHTLVVDQIFAAHLKGQSHGFTATNTVETPSLSELTEAISISDAWFCEYTQTLSTEELNRVIRFRFTDGETGSMSVEEVLTHLINHGSYHRGAAGRALAINSVPPPKDTMTRFLHHIEPNRRW